MHQSFYSIPNLIGNLSNFNASERILIKLVISLHLPHIYYIYNRFRFLFLFLFLSLRVCVRVCVCLCAFWLLIELSQALGEMDGIR